MDDTVDNTAHDAAGAAADVVPVCSARGCRAAARWLLVWNNPRLHTPDREKTWVACEDHRESLSEHLDVRGFLRRVDPLPATPPPAPPPSPAEVQEGGRAG